MSTNCLVTKLKESVQNDNLNKLGEITFIASNRSQYFGINAEQVDTVALSYTGGSGEAYAPTGSGNMYLTYNSDLDHITIKAQPKYPITRISSVLPAGGLKELAYCRITTIEITLGRYNDYIINNISLNFDDLDKWPDKTILKNIIYVQIDGAYAKRNYTKGSLATISKFTNIEKLMLDCTAITGNISQLGTLTSLTDLQINYSEYITGTIEEFVTAQRSKGRTTESTGISVNIENSNITFEGSAVQGTKTLTWTADSISLT